MFYPFREITKYAKYSCFHDDQDGTAVVVVVALLNALKLGEKICVMLS